VKWNNKLLQSKILRIYFYSVVLGGLLLALFGGATGLKIVAVSIGLLFVVLGLGQGYVAFGFITHKDYLGSIPMALIAGGLIAAGVAIGMAGFMNVNT